MFALVYTALFLCAGVMCLDFLLPRVPWLYRRWLGLVWGLMLLLWLPVLMGFLMPFGVGAHMLAAGWLAGVVLLFYRFRQREKPLPFAGRDRALLRPFLLVTLPLMALFAYLYHTHYLRPENGALFVGQATYGDLPLHLAIAKSIPGARLPVDYNILPGQRLSYPFLADSFASTLLVLGLSLRPAFLVSGLLMGTLAIGGFTLFCLRFAQSRKAAVLAALLLFFNGGLGFVYALDMMGVSLGVPGDNQMQMGTWLARLHNILTGFYQTPANHAEFTRYNLRWSNIIADMFLPQRTFLLGFALVVPCFYLLLDALQREDKAPRPFVLLGLMAGLMPLAHTHSFLALFLCSLALFVYRGKTHAKPLLLFAAVTALPALIQLFLFTFRQTGQSGRFLAFQFNWVNGEGGMKDGYFWFYLKNIGLPFAALLLALWENKPRHRLLFTAGALIFLAAETIRFQPNMYDNNKLLYLWWALCAVPVADTMAGLWQRLRGMKSRPLVALLVVPCLFLSAALSLSREVCSSYLMFDRPAVALAAYVEKHTAPRDVFITGTSHINPVSSLAGRTIVVGPDTWLYFHGFDTGERKRDVAAFYQDGAAHEAIRQKYSLAYAVVGPDERSQYQIDTDAFERYPIAYQNEAVTLYRLEDSP